MNKKIIFFVGSLEEGGAERVISMLSGYFAAAGEPVELLLYHDKEIFFPVDKRVSIKVVCKETKSKNLFLNLLWIRRHVKTEAIAVISFLAVFNILSIIASLGIKVPVIVADRNDPQFVPGNIFIRSIRDFLYRFADGIVLQTKKNQEYFSKTVQRKSSVIFNPINLSEFKGKALRTKKDKTIVSVGRLMPQKNQSMLISAFEKLHHEFSEYKLIIYGDGPSYNDLNTLITSLGIEDFAFLPGSEKNIFEKISSADVFVLSSNYEGMPNALAEAMCLGLPCISTKVSGATDLIESGENGILVNINKEAELEDALRRVLSDREFAMQLGENAIQVNDILDYNSIAKQWRTFVYDFIEDN